MAISTHAARAYLKHPVFNAIQRQVLEFILNAIEAISGIIAVNDPQPGDVLTWNGTALIWVPSSAAFDVDAEDLISAQGSNALRTGTDDLLFVARVRPSVLADSTHLNIAIQDSATPSWSNSAAVQWSDMISDDEGNILGVGSTLGKLFVPSPNVSLYVTTDDTGVNFSANGGAIFTLAWEDLVSDREGNVLQAITDTGEGGLFVESGTGPVDPAALISDDEGNALTVGSDDLLLAQGIDQFTVDVGGNVLLSGWGTSRSLPIESLSSSDEDNQITVDAFGFLKVPVAGVTLYGTPGDDGYSLSANGGTPWTIGWADFISSVSNGLEAKTDPGEGGLALADTTVTPGEYGNSAMVAAKFTVDAQGRLTSASENLIEIEASQVGSGVFDSARIPPLVVTTSTADDTLSPHRNQLCIGAKVAVATHDIRLPAAPQSGDQVTVKRSPSSGGEVRAIANTGHTVDDGTRYDLTASQNAVTLVFNGATNWVVVGTHV